MMHSNFYSSFLSSITKTSEETEEEDDRRVYFSLHQWSMIPQDDQRFIYSVIRSYPTPPIYAFLAIGMMGTNIARYCCVGRPGCHKVQSIRTGDFYNFIAESRMGKGIALNLL